MNEIVPDIMAEIINVQPTEDSDQLVEPRQPPNSTNGQRRPSLVTARPDLKRKRDSSEISKSNSTATAFIGGRRHSWILSGDTPAGGVSVGSSSNSVRTTPSVAELRASVAAAEVRRQQLANRITSQSRSAVVAVAAQTAPATVLETLSNPIQTRPGVESLPLSDTSTSHIPSSNFSSRNESITSEGPPKRPRINTTIPTLVNITPPSSLSPVSASITTNTNEREVSRQFRLAASAIPSPLPSPVASSGFIEIPRFLADGDCRNHQIDLRNPSIDDHNILLEELKRLERQIKESKTSNTQIVIRHEKLIKAFGHIRSLLIRSNVTPTTEIVPVVDRTNHSMPMPPRPQMMPPPNPQYAPVMPLNNQVHRTSIVRVNNTQNTSNFRPPSTNPPSAISFQTVAQGHPSTSAFVSSPRTIAPAVSENLPVQTVLPVAPHLSFWDVLLRNFRILLNQNPQISWSNNDTPRLNLVNEAIAIRDDVFLGIHLIFCSVDHPDYRERYSQIREDARSRSGLELLSHLILANTTLSARALDIFCRLPMKLSEAFEQQSVFNPCIRAALDLIQSIRPRFEAVYTTCLQCRLLEPSDAQLVAAGISSPCLRKVITTSLKDMIKTFHLRANMGNTQNRPAYVNTPQTTRASPNTGLSMSQIASRSTVAISPTPVVTPSSMDPPEKPEFAMIHADWGSQIPGWQVIADVKLLPPELMPENGSPDRLYSYFRRCASQIIRLETSKFQIFPMSVDANSKELVNQSTPNPTNVPGLSKRSRTIRNGSLLYRLRCVSSQNNFDDSAIDETFKVWRGQETTWPKCTFAEFNGKQLDFRRKKRWGKDCCTDVTDLVQEGQNMVKAISFDSSTDDGKAFYIAVEELGIISMEDIKKRCSDDQYIKIPEAKELFTNRIKAASSKLDSDELSVVDEDTMIVSIMCPISLKPLERPVRGRHCRHLECFDLDSYLDSRPKYTSGVSVPDAWLCPICRVECTPPLLVSDMFLAETVKLLKDADRLDKVQSIYIRSDGKWKTRDMVEPEGKKQKAPAEVILIDDD